MKKLMPLIVILALAQACGSHQQVRSEIANILQGDGWNISESPYILPPGSTIGVCDQEETDASANVMDAVRIWLDAGGRDGRIRVLKSCTGTRVVYLNKLTEKVDFYGRAHPLSGYINDIDVPSQWAGHWTANHEIGHVFGFAHIFDNVVSIMNSENNGQFMNGGYLSDYDRAEIKRMLSLPVFNAVNELWKKTEPSLPSFKKCLGVDGKTYNPHKVVTEYLSSTFTCNDGHWIRD